MCRALRNPADIRTLAVPSILLLQKLTLSIRNTLELAAPRNMMQIERQFIRYCSLKDVNRRIDALAQLSDRHGPQLSNGKNERHQLDNRARLVVGIATTDCLHK